MLWTMRSHRRIFTERKWQGQVRLRCYRWEKVGVKPDNGDQLGGGCSTISVRGEMSRTEGWRRGVDRTDLRQTWSVKCWDNSGWRHVMAEEKGSYDVSGRRTRHLKTQDVISLRAVTTPRGRSDISALPCQLSMADGKNYRRLSGLK